MNDKIPDCDPDQFILRARSRYDGKPGLFQAYLWLGLAALAGFAFWTAVFFVAYACSKGF